MAADIELDVDSIIARLLEGHLIITMMSIHPWYSHIFSLPPLARGSRTMKTVQLSENEVKGLCLKSREIFLSQPILLELGAPLQICGKEKKIDSFLDPYIYI